MVKRSSYKSFKAILVTPTQNHDLFKSWNSPKYPVEVTKLAIKYFKIDRFA